MDRQTIQEQFGANAPDYITSQPHAKGASLGRLLELVKPEPHWRVLDIATATGHTAFTFAPHVDHVWATDITDEMLAIASEQAGERGFNNVTVEYADAEQLPYADGRFHLVTCRIAPHHFVDVGPFMSEATRVLLPGGILAIVDNIVPDGPPGDYINAFEKLRDPSHGRCLRMTEWQQAYASAGLQIQHQETLVKPMVFESWAARHSPDMQRYLRAMLSEVSGEAAQFLQTIERDGNTVFHLREGLLIGRRPGTEEQIT